MVKYTQQKGRILHSAQNAASVHDGSCQGK